MAAETATGAATGDGDGGDGGGGDKGGGVEGGEGRGDKGGVAMGASEKVGTWEAASRVLRLLSPPPPLAAPHCGASPPGRLLRHRVVGVPTAGPHRRPHCPPPLLHSTFALRLLTATNHTNHRLLPPPSQPPSPPAHPINNGINPCHHPLSPLTKLPSPVDELTTPTSCLRLHPPTSHVSVFIPSSSPHVSVFIPPTFIPPTSPSSSPLRFTFACNLQPSSSPPRLRLHPPPTSPSSSPLRFTLHAICSAITLHAIYQTFLVQR